MLKTVIIAQDPTTPSSWTEADVENVHEYIKKEIGSWTPTTKMYHQFVDSMHEITPFDEGGIDAIDRLPGPFYVVVYHEWAAIPYIIAAIALIVSVVAMSNIPKPVTTDNNIPSPNNVLTDRQNTARPFKRIPDIYGTVRSVPDLIMLPYTVYVDNVAVEHTYLCIGRGKYVILDCRDDTTPIGTIDGASATVYGPNDSPNNQIEPAPYRQSFGTGEVDLIKNVRRMTSVNGQDMIDDVTTKTFSGNWKPIYDAASDKCGLQALDSTDFTTWGASIGDNVDFSGYFGYTNPNPYTNPPSQSFNLNGSYAIASISAKKLLFNTTKWKNATINPGITIWNSEVAKLGSSNLSSTGPFYITDPDTAEVWINLLADNGLYQINSSGTASTVDVGLTITIQPQDSSGHPVGSPLVQSFTMAGNANKKTRAETFKFTLPAVGPCSVLLQRTSVSPHNTQVVDTVKWKDLYGVANSGAASFGDVTTVYAVTKATEGALAVKERKLNLLVQRILPAHAHGQFFFGEYGTNNAADIICAMATDPIIGGRSVDELDVQQIYDTVGSVISYFGDNKFGEFNYTFDDDNTSYEEMIGAVASALHCTAYRQGHTMRLHFEKSNPDSVLLLGHRNILPGSQQRTVSFGNQNDYDFVQYDYISPDDDSKVTLYIPQQGFNPQQVTSTGIRNHGQAHIQAYRIWNKIQYANTTVELTATQEAGMLLKSDRVLIADTTRTSSMDGEVEAQNVLELQLSQPHAFQSGKAYSIFLQGTDGLVESISVLPGSGPTTVILSRAPTVTLNLDENASARTLYWIVPDDDVRPQAFLIQERSPADGFTEKVTAINYDERYYANDLDYKNGLTPL